MNKLEFIKKLSNQCEIDKQLCACVLDNAYFLLCDCLKKGEIINFKGFGKFFVKYRKERFLKMGNETYLIAPKNMPVFKMGKALKNVVK